MDPDRNTGKMCLGRGMHCPLLLIINYFDRINEISMDFGLLIIHLSMFNIIMLTEFASFLCILLSAVITVLYLMFYLASCRESSVLKS